METVTSTQPGRGKARRLALLLVILLLAAGSVAVQGTETIFKKAHTPLKDTYQHGDEVTFTLDLTVKDDAGSDLSIKNLKVTDLLPPGLSYVAGTQTNNGPPATIFNAVGQVLTWDYGAGPFVASPQVHITFKARVDHTVPQNTLLVNQAVAEYRETLTDVPSAPAATDSILVKFPILDIVKDAAPPVIHEGGAITYTVTLSNTGGEDATGVRVEDPLPVQVTYSGGASASSGTLDTSNPLNLVWTGTIPAGGTVTITVPVTDKISVGPNTITDVARYVIYPPNAEMIKLQDDASTQVIHPKIELVKTCVPDAGVEPLNVVYNYFVKNTGDCILTNVKVHDDTLNQDVVLPLPLTLAPGESRAGTLPRNGLMEGVYVNTATAEGYDPLQLKVTAQDDATCTVTKTPPPVVGGTVSQPTPDASTLLIQGAASALAALAAALYLAKRG